MTEREELAEELLSKVTAFLEHTANIYRPIRRQLRSKPLTGGLFGYGGWLLSSLTYVDCGLDRVSYFVMHDETSAALSMSDTKAEALSVARSFLEECRPHVIARVLAALRAEQVAVDEAARRQSRELDEARNVRVARPKSISRKRKQIFDRSQGRCHYCQCELVLEGKWHVEHMMPKSLGGDNTPTNLVAACVPCNLSKRDQTAEEFIARRAGAAT